MDYDALTSMYGLIFSLAIPALAVLLAIPCTVWLVRRAGRPASWPWRVLIWLCLAKVFRGSLHGLAVCVLGVSDESGDLVRMGALVLVATLLVWSAPRLARCDPRAAIPCTISAGILLVICVLDARADPRMTVGTAMTILEAGYLLWGAWRVRTYAARIKLESPNS